MTLWNATLGPAYPTTKLVVIRHKDASGFHEVTLDCAGALEGWVSIGTGGDYEYTYVTLSDGNFVPQVFGGGACDNGSHVADSSGAFSVAVWQWGTAAATVETSAGIIDYQAVSIGYTVPAQTVNPRSISIAPDGGTN